ncbi:hypothetical protein SASPL_121342 [Salvia splendens]|uniref:Replication protein A 70 kDa DNA-binding subunit B/D first OB fold domain-containing protein n=1 Tax=Salvia splendens TaxID=180675 RepID=A0A8X8XX52_SALSN|nr:hypothetical protein SASPL_121342 [Salvia splendens]
MTLEAVFHDRVGTRIQASFPGGSCQKIVAKLREGGIFCIRNFLVKPNNLKNKTTSHEFRLIMVAKTEMFEVTDPKFQYCQMRVSTHFNSSQVFINADISEVKQFRSGISGDPIFMSMVSLGEVGNMISNEFDDLQLKNLDDVLCLQRRAVIDAATKAGLHPLRLIHETDATALAYGFWKTDLSENELMNVAFVDAGQLCIAALKRSPSFEVREFQVNESFPFPISLTWKTPDGDTQNREGGDNLQTTAVFPKGSPIPSMKALTFYMSETFALDVQYADGSELQAPAKISRYTIGPFQSTNGQKAKLEVTVRLNLHGIVSVESATDSETGASAAENGMPESGDKPVQMETDVKGVDAPKKKVNKKTVPVSEVVFGALAAPDVQKVVKELEMALQDRFMKESKDKKNDVESYVYDMRNRVRKKLDDKYYYVVTDSEREQLITGLQEVEDWLYGDGKDETKCVYAAMLEELKKQGDAIEERYKEHTERGHGIGQMICQAVNCINNYTEAAMSTDTMFDHIDVAEKQKVLNECVEAEAWLREKVQDVNIKFEALDRYCTNSLK